MLAISLTALLGVLPYFLSFDVLREQIINQVQADTQRTMTISGSAHMVLLPRPAILISNTTLTEPNARTVFAHADRVKVVFRLWPLITTGKPVVHAIEIDQPELNIVRHENGTYNFEDLLRPHSDTTEFALDKLSFNQAHLNWQDDFLGGEVSLSNLDLTLDQLTDPKDGRLKVDGQITLGENKAGASWQGQVVGTAAMRYLEKERTLRVADIVFDVTQRGQSDEKLKLSEAHLQATGNLNYSWQPLRLAGGDMKITTSAVRAGQHWNATLDVPDISLTESALGLHRLKLKIGMKDQQSEFNATTNIPTMGGGQRGFLRTDSAQINVRYKSPEQDLSVQLVSPLELYRGHLARLPSYTLTGSYTNINLPRGAIRLALSGRGDLDMRDENLSLDSVGTLDGEHLSSQINLENFLDPQFRVNIDLAKLDLTPYLPVVAKGAKTVNHNAAFDFWWLEKLKALGSVKIGELVLQNLHVDDLAFTLLASNKRLVLDPLSATLYEGRLNGRAEIDAGKKPAYFRLEQTLSNMNINTLLTDTIDNSRFEGRSDLTLDVAAVGNKLSDLSKTAGGNIKIRLKQGAIRGIDIPLLLRTASQQIKLMNGETAPFSVKDARTQFSELQATWLLKHGLASNNDLNVRAGILKLTGGGQIDLGAGQLNYMMKASANPDVPELSGLKGLVLPISFTGPLNAPEYKADYASLKEQIVHKQKAEQEAQQAQEKAKAAAAEKKAAAQRKAAANSSAKSSAKTTPPPAKKK
ncbi:AsmA family protein [Chitinibacter bivalviorum]|uniref:AsmA family protein n=1 Tax=Chitinibacter bivalviorum TaxID=2739434 RepID=A0A7H9BGQ1_9NEIS|nr:AsmA family protein [Chitinibacter bivalviorum]